MGDRGALVTETDRSALAAWGLEALLGVSEPVTGSVNRVLRVETEEAVLFLRISRRERSRVEWEHACLVFAAAHGLPVCCPIPQTDGNTIWERDGAFYALFPGAAGRQFAREELSGAQIGAAGACLAQIHHAFAAYPMERAPRKNLRVDPAGALAAIPDLEAAIQALPHPTETDRAALAQLAGRREHLGRVAMLAEDMPNRLAALPQRIVHGDFQETNLFFEGSRVSAVIDWDQSGRAPRGWDIVRALHLMLRLGADSCRVFLAGYRAVLPFPEDELQESAACYGVLADSNMWVYEAAYREGSARAKAFITTEPFVPFAARWAALALR